MADATSLPALKKKWDIPEKPLSQSFRCNNAIAEAVRNISGNTAFVGCGSHENEWHRPFIIREPTARFSQCLTEFECLVERAGILQSKSAILCRGHEQIESIRGEVNYIRLQGLTKEMAQAAFHRDILKDYKKAQQIVETAVRQMTEEHGIWETLDEHPESEASHRVRLALWRFTKSSGGLPSVNENGTEWIDKLKANLTQLFSDIGIVKIPMMGSKIRRTGLKQGQLTLPLFQPQTVFPRIRQETIHQVKGESIDGVLVLGSSKFFNAVVAAIESSKNTEERRLAYVAMTRARHALLIGLPASHYDKHVSSWKKWGFGVLWDEPRSDS